MYSSEIVSTNTFSGAHGYFRIYL